jgi:hypothetical protein
MKILGLIMMMVLVIGVNRSYGIETCCPPVITCPEVNVKCECPIITECPQLNAVCECDCGKEILPGLHEVVIKGKKRCGMVTIIGAGVAVDQGDGKPDYFLFNMIRRFEKVESCE